MIYEIPDDGISCIICKYQGYLPQPFCSYPIAHGRSNYEWSDEEITKKIRVPHLSAKKSVRMT